MGETSKKKGWIELILMPLAVTLVGTAGTYFITREQRHAAEISAIADRQIRIIEIFADKYTSSDENERLLAIGLTGTLDPDLSAKILTTIDLTAEKSVAVREAIDSLTARAIASQVPTMDGQTQTPESALTGRWLLRRQGVPPNEARVVNWMQFESTPSGLSVHGDRWAGKVSFDGRRGHYNWTFEDGRTGRTDIYLDTGGTLFGKVRGAGLDWTYWATRDFGTHRLTPPRQQ